MAWTLYSVPSAKKTEAETVLHDDVVSRQSHKVRDAVPSGGPAGQLYILVDGSPEGIARADELLAPLGTKIPKAEADALYRKFKDEEDAASEGMGLFFTE
jgi:hypothetical protein